MTAKRKRQRPVVGRSYKQNPERTYMGDIRAAPFMAQAEIGLAVPYFGIWVDAATGQVVSTVVAVEKPHEALAETLFDPMYSFSSLEGAIVDATVGPPVGFGDYELPGQVIVFDPALADVLRPNLARLGVTLVLSEPIDPFDELYSSLFEALSNPTPSFEINISDDALVALCDAAERLWKEKPWKYCFDQPPIGVEPLEGTGKPVYAAILGRAGEVFGVALFNSLEDYGAFGNVDLGPPDGASIEELRAFEESFRAMHSSLTYLVSFDQKVDVDPLYVDRLIDAGWSRRYRVVPVFMCHGGEEPMRLFNDQEARRFWSVIEAITVFCQQIRPRIHEIEYLPVQLVSDIALRIDSERHPYRLTMPPDMPKPRGSRRRRPTGSWERE